MKVMFCTPTREAPSDQYSEALKASLPLLEANGIEHGLVIEAGPYISANMATLARRALDAKPDALVFIDDDMSWEPAGLLKLIQCAEDVVGGTYRFKKDDEDYMGQLHTDSNGIPIGKRLGSDILIKAKRLPTGFLKITVNAVDKFMKAYPQLICGPAYHPTPDLFNHGVIDGLWFGQDYAFCHRYEAKCGAVWCLPDLTLTHHALSIVPIEGRPGEFRREVKGFVGNYHQFMLRQPGGQLSANPTPPPSLASKIEALRGIPVQEVA